MDFLCRRFDYHFRQTRVEEHYTRKQFADKVSISHTRLMKCDDCGILIETIESSIVRTVREHPLPTEEAHA